MIKRVQRALFFRFGGKGVYTDVHDRHPQTKKSAICALFINLVVRSMGLEPIRSPIRPSNVRVCLFRHDRIFI